MSAIAAVLIGPVGLAAPASADSGERPASLPSINLGTLVPQLRDEMSPISVAEAIDDDIVVGSSVVGFHPPVYDPEFVTWDRPAKSHAFAYDLGAERPEMIDLGTLGGSSSEAVDVDDGIVVGSSDTAGDERRHAFYYDLDAEHPRMIDLGTMDGVRSEATAVDDGIVVGNFWADGAQHAFAYDLNASNPIMTDLGFLGSRGGIDMTAPQAFATGVDDGVVVGHAIAADGRSRAWAYDLNEPGSGMRNLGNLGGNGPTRTNAVDDGLVVGFSYAMDEEQRSFLRPFVVDLSQPDAVMQDLGTALDEQARAVDVEAGRIVGFGWSESGDGIHALTWQLGPEGPTERDLGRIGDGPGRVVDVDASGRVTAVASIDQSRPQRMHAFTYDLDSDDANFTDVGGLGQIWDTSKISVDNGVLASTGDRGATAWPLTETVRLKRSSVAVSEASRAATIRVMRTGDIDHELSVDYATLPGSARAGRDFERAHGTLSFAPGQATTSFRVRILNDRRPERRERIRVRLNNLPAEVRFLGGSAGHVVVRPSDQRPDLQVSRARRTGYVGGNLYNTTGKRQVRRVKVRRGEARRFFVKLQHDGNARTPFRIKQMTRPAGLRVRYSLGGRNVTRAVASQHGRNVWLRPGRSRVVRVDVAVMRRTRAGAKAVKVAGIWTGDRRITDAVRAVVRVVR